MVMFYEMADGCLIAEAGAGKSPRTIQRLQETDWARKHGGICNILEYTEEHAVFFALHQDLGKAHFCTAIGRWVGRQA